MAGDRASYSLGDAVGTVLRKALRVRGNWSPPDDLPGRIMPVIEARSSRAWEQIYEDLIPFWRQITIPAVAARFSGVFIGQGGTLGAAHYLVYIYQLKTTTVGGSNTLIRAAALPAFANNVAGGLFSRDLRLNVAEMFNGIWQGGDLAALVAGPNYETLAAGELREVEMVNQNPDPNGLGWLLQNTTANVALDLGVRGVIIPLDE